MLTILSHLSDTAQHLDAASWGMSGEERLLLGNTDRVKSTILFALIPVVVAFSFIVFILYRARREAFFREKETAFKLNISELELKVLRTQINPHFIFNCLNSIHHFIQRSNVSVASEYLIKFSRLIRHVLETSYDRMIPLSEEIGALTLYAELEQLRTNNSFSFQVSIDAGIGPDTYIPPLLIQPFVENSIWHGLAGVQTGGLIKVSVGKTGDMLRCIIEDNGHEPAGHEPDDLANLGKRKSRGMSIIHNRLEIINKVYATHAGFSMERYADGQQSGTRVTLTLPYED